MLRKPSNLTARGARKDEEERGIKIMKGIYWCGCVEAKADRDRGMLAQGAIADSLNMYENGNVLRLTKVDSSTSS